MLSVSILCALFSVRLVSAWHLVPWNCLPSSHHGRSDCCPSRFVCIEVMQRSELSSMYDRCSSVNC